MEPNSRERARPPGKDHRRGGAVASRLDFAQNPAQPRYGVPVGSVGFGHRDLSQGLLPPVSRALAGGLLPSTTPLSYIEEGDCDLVASSSIAYTQCLSHRH